MPSPVSSKPTKRDLEAALQDAEKRLACVIDLSRGYFWEQNEQGKFTLVDNGDPRLKEHIESKVLGKARWELCATPVYGTWEEHRETYRKREPFRNFLLRVEDEDGYRFVSTSGEPVFGPRGGFKGYRGVTRDVTGQHRSRQFGILERNILEAFADTDDYYESLQWALQEICELMGWEAGQYWSADNEHGVLRYVVGWHLPRPELEEVTFEARQLELPISESIAAAVWDSGEPVWLGDLSSETLARRDIVERTGWNSALVFPVYSDGEIVGLLDFNAPRIAEPDERLKTIIGQLAVHVGNFYKRSIAIENLRRSEELYASTVELAAMGICHVGTDGRFLHVNGQLCEMLGYGRAELMKLTIHDVCHPKDARVAKDEREQLHRGEIDVMKAEKRYLRKNGTTIWVRITAVSKRAPDGSPLHDIAIVEDISDRKRAEARIQFLATHDEMTSLPNRELFARFVRQAIATAQRSGRQCSVLFLDLDRFKIINDSLGHEAGDALLREISTRFKKSIRSSDFLARFGGDEFVILLQDAVSSEPAQAVARKLLNCVLEPVHIRGHECRVTASIGIATYPGDALDAETLIKNADMAMYAAKEQGKNTFEVYSKNLSPISVERLTLETNLRRALECSEFSIQYQAKQDLHTGRISGVEALLRWWNHELGTVSPVQFVPVAEDTGLIVPIGRWVLQKSCEQSMLWQRQGLPKVKMAVNLSPRQFNHVGLIEDVSSALKTTGLPPELLELEITESAIMTNVDRAVEIVTDLKKLGIRLAIDDFGTGYSSLAQLKRFPIDILKVDRSFVRDVATNAQDRAITQAIISMGSTLGVQVVAEGVETYEQYAFTRECGCDEVQGYYISKPCHPRGFAELLIAEEQQDERADQILSRAASLD